MYVGLEDVVECGVVVVVELTKFSFVRVLRTSGGSRSSGRGRPADPGRSVSGRKSGTG